MFRQRLKALPACTRHVMPKALPTTTSCDYNLPAPVAPSAVSSLDSGYIHSASFVRGVCPFFLPFPYPNNSSESFAHLACSNTCIAAHVLVSCIGGHSAWRTERAVLSSGVSVALVWSLRACAQPFV